MDWMDGYIKLWNGKLHLCVNKQTLKFSKILHHYLT